MTASPTGPEAPAAPTLEPAGALPARFASLPWWRRPRRIRRQVAVAMVATSLLAVATFGGLNFFAARGLLVTSTQNQLAAVGLSRAQSIDAGTQRLVAEISSVATYAALGAGLEAFEEEFEALNEQTLTPEQVATLTDWYEEELVTPWNEAGLGPVTAEDLIPATPAGQWLQYYYTVREPGQPAPVDPGDGSGYTELNVRVNEDFTAFSDARGGGDILLIDPAGTIVHSLDKYNDVGTNLETGPYAGTALARVVTDGLPQARVGTTLLTDFAVYASGRAALFAVTAVRSGSAVVGALALEIPVGSLNSLVSAGDDWEAIGLAEGDAYIVASDLTLQSEPRAWLEDPEGYLENLRGGDEQDQREADLIELFGSPVGIQQIDSTPVLTALDGNAYQGNATSTTGEGTFTAASAFDASGRQWVVVTEVPRSVALQPLTEYLVRILIVLAIVLPVVGGVGIWLSRLLTRPIRPTVAAAEAIVEGDRNPDLDLTRPDEFGDLARRLTAMSDALAKHENELADEYERTRQLLLAVLPPQLVDDDGRVTGTGEAAERATVVSVAVRPSDEHLDQEYANEVLSAASELAEQIAVECGMERVRTAADRSLFLAGMSEEDAGADAALQFAVEFRRRLASESDAPLELQVGISSGPVATGVLDTGSLTFGAWGEPVRRALALGSLSQADALLIDDTTVREASLGRWQLEPAHDIVDLDGHPMDLSTL